MELLSTLFFGIFLFLIGVMVTFAGYQLFRVLIPIWGFIAGFSWMVNIFSIGNGAGFLMTVLGMIIGLFVGIVLAALAYFFYEFAVGLFAVSLGYWAVGGLLFWLGFPMSFFGVTTSFVAGLVLAWAAIYYKAPKGILIALTAVGGGVTTIAGVMVFFGLISPTVLGYGLMGYIIKQSFLWVLIWIGLTVIGVLTQIQLSRLINADSYYSYPTSSTMTSFTGVKGGTASKEKIQDYK